jgi:hypothetical protein
MTRSSKPSAKSRSDETNLAELEQLAKQYAGMGLSDPNEWKDAPRWSNEEAQLEYVRNRVLGYWSLEFPYRTEEERAVEAALRGKPKKLAALIRQPNPQLAPSTWALVAEFVEGKRSLRSGRAKSKSGAPRQSEKQRRARAIAHQAAEIFFVIRDTLPRIYPKQSQADIRDRALLLAATLKGVETETITNHLKKSKDDRLPYRIYGYEEEDSPSGKWWSPDLL